MDVHESIHHKQTTLEARLAELDSVAVAYSGGVDSAFLAYAAHKVLGSSALAVLADSPSLARSQYSDAVAFAAENSIPLRIIETAELDDREYVRNGPDRCFYCKRELFAKLEDVRREIGFAALAYGMNTDDYSDFRPGRRAAEMHQVVAPLAEARLSKADVRELARLAGLRIWDKPASACLASRVEYGRAVTPEVLQVVERAEKVLGDLGFRQFRVRHHGDIARIEIAREEMALMFSAGAADRIAAELKRLGFKFVVLDLEGYRSGSLNSFLPVNQLGAPAEK